MNFDEIYDTYADSVYSYLKFKIKDIHLVEDIFQDTFLSVYQHVVNGSLINSLKPWIFTLAHHKMVDRLRQKKDEVVAIDWEPPPDWSENNQLVDGILIQQMLDQLDEQARSIIYGIYVAGMTYKEMAEMLDLPEGTVKSKCYYAKNKLLHWLKEEENGTTG